MRLVTVALQCRWEKTVGSCARIRAPSESHLLIGCRAPKSIDWVASAQSLGLLPGQSSCQINVKDALNARPMVNSRMSVHPNYLHIIYIYICNIHVYIMYIFYHIKKDIYIYIYIHTYTYAYTISMYKCSIPQPFGAHSCDTTESSWMAVSAKTSASRDSALVVSTFRGSWKALRMGVLRAINGFYHQEWCKNWDVTKHGALP